MYYWNECEQNKLYFWSCGLYTIMELWQMKANNLKILTAGVLLIFIGQQIVISQDIIRRELHVCNNPGAEILLNCTSSHVILVESAVVGVSDGWTSGVENCPRNNETCVKQIARPFEDCDYKSSCSLPPNIILNDLRNRCPATNYINITYACLLVALPHNICQPLSNSQISTPTDAYLATPYFPSLFTAAGGNCECTLTSTSGSVDVTFYTYMKFHKTSSAICTGSFDHVMISMKKGGSGKTETLIIGECNSTINHDQFNGQNFNITFRKANVDSWVMMLMKIHVEGSKMATLNCCGSGSDCSIQPQTTVIPATTSSVDDETADTTPRQTFPATGCSEGCIAGIALAFAVVIVLIVVIALMYKRRKKRSKKESSSDVVNPDGTEIIDNITYSTTITDYHSDRIINANKNTMLPGPVIVSNLDNWDGDINASESVKPKANHDYLDIVGTVPLNLSNNDKLPNYEEVGEATFEANTGKNLSQVPHMKGPDGDYYALADKGTGALAGDAGMSDGTTKPSNGVVHVKGPAGDYYALPAKESGIAGVGDPYSLAGDPDVDPGGRVEMNDGDTELVDNSMYGIH